LEELNECKLICWIDTTLKVVDVAEAGVILQLGRPTGESMISFLRAKPLVSTRFVWPSPLWTVFVQFPLSCVPRVVLVQHLRSLAGDRSFLPDSCLHHLSFTSHEFRSLD
jgi:hypothetical protein